MSESNSTTTDDIYCRKCEKEIEDDAGFECDGCWDSYHLNCGEALKRDINARKNSKRLQIYCTECISVDPMRVLAEDVRSMMKYIYKIDLVLQKQIEANATFENDIKRNATILGQIHEQLKMMLNAVHEVMPNINALQNGTSNVASYASVVGDGGIKPTVMIKPKKKHSTKQRDT